MARVRKNLVLGELSGKLGNLVVRQLNGKSVVQTAPTRTAAFTEGELQNQRSFKEANAYAQRARQNPALWARYAAEAKKRGGTSNAHAVALSDFRHPPVLHTLAVAAEERTAQRTLRIQASDNFGVERVEVNFYQTGWQTTALAEQITGDTWELPLPVGVIGEVVVTIFDYAGNVVNGSILV